MSHVVLATRPGLRGARRTTVTTLVRPASLTGDEWALVRHDELGAISLELISRAAAERLIAEG